MPQDLRLTNRALGRSIKVSQARRSPSKIHHDLPFVDLDLSTAELTLSSIPLINLSLL